MKKRLASILLILIIFYGFSYAENRDQKILFFYSNDCEECQAIKETLIPVAKHRFPDIKIVFLEIHDPENLDHMLSLEKIVGEIKNPPPTVIAGNILLDGTEAVNKGLLKTMENLAHQTSIPFSSETKRNDEDYSSIILKFQSLGILSVIAGGLLDGINPCAFTAIVFLVSFLSLRGRSEKEIFTIGSVFTIGVFLSYLAIGLGLTGFFRSLSFVPWIEKTFNMILGIAAYVLGALSLYDYFQVKKNRTDRIILQLTPGMKRKVHGAIRSTASPFTKVIAPLFAGALVALFEFPCTGQIYFPIVAIIQKAPALRLYGIAYLFLYNIMFIVPLVAVFLLAYKGMSSTKMAKFAENKLGHIKLFTSVLFVILGSILLFI
jgi:cytochrome c biogenesis protein CcdA